MRRSHTCGSEVSPTRDAFWFSHDATQTQFHHFMLEWLPQLAYVLATVSLENVPRNMTIVVDSKMHSTSFFREAILALGLPLECLTAVAPNSSVCVPQAARFLYGEKLVANFGALSYPAAQLIRRFHKNLHAPRPGLGMYSAAASALVYIDRFDAPAEAHYKRVLTNRAELAEALMTRGFEQHTVSERSFLSRVRLLSRARLVLMQAGSTQVNMLFTRPHTTVAVIAHPLGASINWNTLWYSWLCEVASCRMLMLNNTRLLKRRALEPWQNSYTADLQPLLAQINEIVASVRAPASEVALPHCKMSCDMVDYHSRSKKPALLPVDASRLNTCALTCWGS